MNRRGRLSALIASVSAFACSGGTKYIGSDTSSDSTATECAPSVAPPAALGLDPFYEKYVDARGIPVVSSANVSEEALARACEITNHVLGKRPDVHQSIVDSELLVGVIAEDEVLTDIPEYRDIYGVYPGNDWDSIARSFGPYPGAPVASVAEENLLCSADDLFGGEVMLLHSLGHGLRRFGILEVDPEWNDRLQEAYEAAMDAGLWNDTHAGSTYEQYFAEGVQGWYDANQAPEPGIHNDINTRVELEAYDPELAGLIREHVPDDAWRPPCVMQP